MDMREKIFEFGKEDGNLYNINSVREVNFVEDYYTYNGIFYTIYQKN